MRLSSSPDKAVEPKTQPVRNSIVARWKEFWALVGPIITVVGVTYAALPSISIELGANLDSDKPLQTLFIITNTGGTPAWSLHFQCAPAAGAMYVQEIATRLKPLDALGAGEQVTRTCLLEATEFHQLALTMTVHYVIPVISWHRMVSKRYEVVKTSKGYALTPESERGRQAEITISQ